MKTTEMVNYMRAYLSDEQKIGWPTDTELISYLDRAANYLTEVLIKAKFPPMLGTFKVARVGLDNEDYPTPLPEDFVRVHGRQPIEIVGRWARAYPSATLYNRENIDLPRGWVNNVGTLTVKYWKRLPLPSYYYIEGLPGDEYDVGTALNEGDKDEIIPRQEALIICDIARMFAQNRNEYDITHDITLQNQIDALTHTNRVGDS